MCGVVDLVEATGKQEWSLYRIAQPARVMRTCDRCNRSPLLLHTTSQDSVRSQHRTPTKRLTKFNFSLSTPSALRTFLTSHSLPTIGDRPALEARVSDWILLFNSNLDTSHPRSLAALRAKLAEMEASRKRDKERGKEALGEKIATRAGMQEYARERKGEFERLREMASRGRRGKGEGEGGLGEGQGRQGGAGGGKEVEGGGGGSEGAAIVVD